jgi:hypothetical protein
LSVDAGLSFTKKDAPPGFSGGACFFHECVALRSSAP